MQVYVDVTNDGAGHPDFGLRRRRLWPEVAKDRDMTVAEIEAERRADTAERLQQQAEAAAEDAVAEVEQVRRDTAAEIEQVRAAATEEIRQAEQATANASRPRSLTRSSDGERHRAGRAGTYVSRTGGWPTSKPRLLTRDHDTLSYLVTRPAPLSGTPVR